MVYLKYFRHIRIQPLIKFARNMSKFSVRCVENEPTIQISFEYAHNGTDSRVFNAERQKTEDTGNALGRISQNINKHVNKKARKRKRADGTAENEQQISVKLFETDGTTQILEDVQLAEALKHERVVIIESEKYVVDLNPPSCQKIALPQTAMVGFPIFPKLDVEFCKLEDSDYKWEKVKYQEEDSSKKAQKPPPATEVARSAVGNELLYTPTNEDIGYRLSLTCIPKNGSREGRLISAESKYEVTAGPGFCPFENRHLYTQKNTSAGEIRVVSYNILADIYADQDFSRDVLFNYCPAYALSMDYRKPLIIKELKGYNSDVICLQEVDTKVFNADLSTALDLLGYDGFYKEKDGEVREGSAIFFRRSKFKLLCEHSEVLKNVLEHDKVCEDLVKKTYTVPALKEKLETRSTIIHVLALESLDVPGRVLLLANTHLYFHPSAAHIRMVQVLTAMRYLEKLMQTYKKQKPCLIFCGDFNSTPTKAIYEFMTTKQVKADNEDWMSSGEEQYVPGMNFSHSFNLDSACGVLPYTNYTEGFKGHLDYIYYDEDSLEVTQVIPLPEDKDLEFHTAIPSIVFPSDHIAQICDLKWKDN